jgi:tetratricopeptide (TPR) repeat protein
MPAAFAGAVSIALRLHGPVTPDALSSAATPAYDRGLYLLRRDHLSFDEAIASFEQATRVDPASSLPLAGLVEAKIMKFEVTHQENCLDDARRSLRAAESLSPDSPRVRMAAGYLKETAGKYEQALEDYLSVQDHEPRNVDDLRRIAGVYDKLDMPAQAIEAYQKAIELDPDYYGGYHGLGVLYYYHGNYPEAARQFQKSIERAPGLFDEYTNLGAALDELGQDAEAEKALLTSLRLRETPRALNSMGPSEPIRRKMWKLLPTTRALRSRSLNYIYLENLAGFESPPGAGARCQRGLPPGNGFGDGYAQGKPPPRASSRVCCLHRSPARRPQESGRRDCAGFAIGTWRDQGHPQRCTDL